MTPFQLHMVGALGGVGLGNINHSLEISTIPVAWMGILLSGAAGNTLLIPEFGALCSTGSETLASFGGVEAKAALKHFHAPLVV